MFIAVLFEGINFRLTAMNEASDKLVKKIIPEADIEDHINRYIMA